MSNIHAEAAAAMHLWSKEYLNFDGNALAFYNQLSATQKIQCREVVDAARRIDRRADPVHEITEDGRFWRS